MINPNNYIRPYSLDKPYRRLFLLLLLCFSLCALSSQSPNEKSEINDSLINLLEQELTDTARLNILTALVPLVSSEHATEYLNEAKDLATRLKSEFRFQNVSYAEAQHIRNKGASSEAIELFTNLLERIESTAPNELCAKICISLADLHKFSGNFDEFERFATKAKILSEEFNMPSQIGNAYCMLSTLSRQQGMPEKALKLIDSASLYIQNENEDLMLFVSNTRGLIYKDIGEYDSAHYYYSLALKLVEKNLNETYQSQIINNLGTVSHSKGALDDALKYYSKSLSIKERLLDKKGMALAYHNMGAVRLDLNSYEEALADFKKSLALSEETEFKKMVIHNSLNIGNALYKLNQIPQALVSYDRCVASAKEMKYTSGLILGSIGRAKCHKELKDFSASQEDIYTAIRASKESKHKASHGQALTLLAELYITKSKEDPNFQFSNTDINVEDLFLEGLHLAKETENYISLETSLSALRNYYHHLGKYKQEAEIAEEYRIFRDSLFNKEKADAIAQWETQYETKEKERELILVQKERELDKLKTRSARNRYFLASILLLLIASTAFLNLYYRSKQRRVEQIEVLRNKISSDLHDDVGSLLTGMAMQSEILKMSATDRDKNILSKLHNSSVTALSRMRDAVWALDTSKDNMEALEDRIKDFTELQLGSTDIGYSLDINYGENRPLLPHVRQHCYLIFKEALTNAIKHSSGDHIHIVLKSDNKSLTLEVNDNGQASEIKKSGLGLTSMKRRAEKVNGNLQISHSENGFKLKLDVPSS